MKKQKFKYYNRDISWLRFNHRVLQEMEDQRNPLMERLKFAAIFSSNLNEFFEVRVSEIRRIKSLDKPLRKKLISKPNRLLKSIKKHVHQLEKKFEDGLFNNLIPQLNEQGFKLLTSDKFDTSINDFCRDYFSKNIKQDLKSQTNFNTEKDRLFIKSGQVYLVGEQKEGIIIFELPSNHDRFIEYKKNAFIFLDDLIRVNLSAEFDSAFYSIKASRDAELYIQDEYSGNLKEKIENALSNRDTGQFTTAMIDSAMPDSYKQRLFEALDISEIDIIFGGRYHKLKDMFGLNFSSDEEYSMKSLAPIRRKSLACHNCILQAIKDKDRLLSFPYETFEDIIRFVEEAAVHSDVKAIKATLYRVSKTSAVAKGLMQALKNGKTVCVFIETKARFDESNNIYWGEKLSKAGAKVIYSYPGIKVHSKIMYVKAEDENGIQEYAYIGTGNFNESTSKIYTDYGLMTANKKITAELGRIFQLLEGKVIIPKVKKLLVSPFTTRRTIAEAIKEEIEIAKQGKAAYLIFKMNSLQDRKMIDLLYQASNAGVKIQLIVRGICCLIPGVKDMSENIEVYSIVDRFLEHGRAYIFGNDGNEKMYIGSADLMTRNLDNRIEVLTPIVDKDVYELIRKMINLQLDDKVKSRIIDEKQKNNYTSDKGIYTESSQHQTYEFLKAKNEAFLPQLSNI